MNPQTPSVYKPSKTPMIAAMVLGILFIAAAVFAFWAFSGRQDYKNNVDKKVASAVANAQAAQAAQLQAQFDEQSKSPYKTFTGPETFGSVSFQYPKSWSAYVDQTDTTQPVEGYFYPDIVPGIQGSTAFALRVELVSDDYSSVVGQYEAFIQDGSVKAGAYIPPKMKKVSGATIGLRLDGGINQDASGNTQQGSMVILKVRDKTLQVYTESPKYLSDFNKVLNSLNYKP